MSPEQRSVSPLQPISVLLKPVQLHGDFGAAPQPCQESKFARAKHRYNAAFATAGPQPWIFRSPRSSSRSGTRSASSAPRSTMPIGWRRIAAATSRTSSTAAMAEAGWLGIAMPEEHGGAGLGITEAAIVMQAVAQSGAGVQRRLGGAHEHFRPAPGRRVRHRRAEAALAAAADRRQGQGLLRGDRARCRARHHRGSRRAPSARRRRLRDLRPQDLDLDRPGRRQDADPDPHHAVRGGAAPDRRA